MRRVLLVTAALAGLGTLGLWGLRSEAQVIDGTPCKDECYEDKAICVEECSQHPNPMECEHECQEILHDCVRDCPG